MVGNDPDAGLSRFRGGRDGGAGEPSGIRPDRGRALGDLTPAALADIVLAAIAGSSVAPNFPASCDMLFTGDIEMADLNGRFRQNDNATNVLAFPSGEPCDAGIPSFLGGIALSFDRVGVEAGERGIPVTDHATHLTLHGMLHLLGYDHEVDVEREEMERVEVSILAGLGIKDPYEGS